MKKLLFALPLLALSFAAGAQDQVKLGDLLDLEDRVILKEMNEKLKPTGPAANTPPPIPVVAHQPKVVYPTEALAVYGTSATFYEGQLSINGRVYTVRVGTPVDGGYIVTAVTPAGIMLTRPRQTAATKSKRPAGQGAEVVFAPLVSG